MGLLLRHEILNDSTYQEPISECYIRIEDYVISNNPAFLRLRLRFFKSKELADDNKGVPGERVTTIHGLIDPYEIKDGELTRIPNRLSIPLIKIVDGIETYDIKIITDIYSFSYELLKQELNKMFPNSVIEDI